MVIKKQTMDKEPEDLWKKELVKPISIKDFAIETADTEKMIVFGESNTGKSTFYISILEWLDEQGVKPEDLKMCIIYPDRPTGITKLYNNIPEKYRGDSVQIFPINTYEELVSCTSTSDKILDEHYKKTGKLGWLVVELLEDAWKSVQDYYCRLAYGESLGEYFAKKRADVKAMKEDTTAYRALEGWGDWTIIKYFHNFNWIDKIKRMPWNVVFTSEIREEGNKDSIFFDLGYRPAGEKDNMHRVDTIIYLSHKGNKFNMKPYKLTGYKMLYPPEDITGKSAYVEHKKLLKKLANRGLKQTAIEELEKEAGIEVKKTEKKKEKIPTKKEETKGEKKEDKKDGGDDWSLDI